MKSIFIKKKLFYIYFYVMVLITSFCISSIIFYDIQIANLYNIHSFYYNDLGEYMNYVLLNSYEFYGKVLNYIYFDMIRYDLKSIIFWITIAKNLEFKSLTEESIQLYYSLYIYICNFEMHELLKLLRKKIELLTK